MRNTTIEEYKHGRCTIKIVLDDDPRNPRTDSDQVGTMCCWHGRYNLGDKPYRGRSDSESPDAVLNGLAEPFIRDISERVDRIRDHFHYDSGYATRAERILAEAQQKALDEQFVMLPLYLYDHGGITMSTGSFSCQWDSGSVGFIYCSLKTALCEWGTKGQEALGWAGEASFTLKPDGSKHTLREAVEKYLESEVEEYDQYLTGQVYGYIVEPENCSVNEESCWGFFGEIDYVKGEAESIADGLNKEMDEIDALNALTEREAELAEVWP